MVAASGGLEGAVEAWYSSQADMGFLYGHISHVCVPSLPQYCGTFIFPCVHVNIQFKIG